MDVSLKYESWVACTIITNAAQRESSKRRSRDSLGIPGGELGDRPRHQRYRRGGCIASRFDKIELVAFLFPPTEYAGTRPHFAVPIICRDNLRFVVGICLTQVGTICSMRAWWRNTPEI